MIVEVLEKDEYDAVMKAHDLGSDNAARPKDDQLTAAEQKIIAAKFCATAIMAHRFESLFKGTPAPPAAPAEGETANAEAADSMVVMNPAQ